MLALRSALLGTCSAMMGRYFGFMLGLCRSYVEACWAILGLCWPMLGHVGPMLGLCWPMLGLCWAHFGRMLAHVGPILGHVETKFGNLADFRPLEKTWNTQDSRANMFAQGKT